MSGIQTVQVDRYVPETVSGALLGGAVSTVLALLTLFVAPVSGALGIGLLLVAWPAIGGAVAAAVEASRGHETSVAGVLAGVYGALVLSVVVLLTGVAGLWTSAVHGLFGVALWPVVFAVLVVVTISWAALGHAGGFVARQSVGE